MCNTQGSDAKFYDKQTKRALEEGAITELNQNDIHNHNEQPGGEYWNKRMVCFGSVHDFLFVFSFPFSFPYTQKRQEVAKEFGKYAHIAPTQVQQTRNQITSLAAEAIVALSEADELRARRRKTQREVRAKYGWQLCISTMIGNELVCSTELFVIEAETRENDGTMND